MRWFFFLLPWIELFTLIKLGGEIGALATVLYVFATLMLGIALLRLQGLEMLATLRQTQMGMVVAQRSLGRELVLSVAAILLMVPGLLTDTIGYFLVLVGLFQRLFSGPANAANGPGPHFGGQTRHDHAQNERSQGPRGASQRPFQASSDGNSGRPASGQTLEGEFDRLDD